MLAGADERRKLQVFDCRFVAEAVAASTRVRMEGHVLVRDVSSRSQGVARVGLGVSWPA